MKPIKRYIVVNLIITIIISIASFLILTQTHKVNELKKIDKSIALHQQQLESFINDSISTVENLSTIIDITNSNQTINKSINKIKRQEPRYKNIYILNKQSIVINSSNPALIGKQLKSFQYFNKNVNLNNISISGKEKDMNGLDVIYVSKFIPDNTNRMIVLLEMDLNGILTVIDALQSSTTVTLKDFDGQTIFQSAYPVNSNIKRTVSFQDVPWKLTMTSNENIYLKAFNESLLIFFITSLIVALIQLLVFNRESLNEKLKLQEEINLQKKELIGMLAANTAHEIKNPLTAVKGFIDLLEMKYDMEKNNPHFGVIKSELDRINDIVSQFLLLGKPTSVSEQLVNSTEVIKDVLNFLKYDLDANHIKVISRYAEEPAYTNISPDQLKQIIINIIQNAKEAILENSKGIIEVKVLVNEYIYITIRDNGCGMNKETVKHLFDPFFTTKDNGTGLGLPVTKSIIEAYGGHISVTSGLNKGTTFIIQLPKAK